MRCITAALVLLSLLPLTYGQGKLRLEFPDEGQRKVWVADEISEEPPGAAEGVSTRSFSISTPTVVGSAKIFVWDEDANRVAVKALKELPSSAWSLKATDFKFLGLVRVRVQQDGKPVAAASVTLRDARRAVSHILDASANGEAEFFGVAPGAVHLQSQYRSAGKTVSQAERHTLDLREKGVPVLVMNLTGPTDTLDSTMKEPKESPGKAAPPAQPQEGNPMILYLLGIALGLGILYALYTYLTRSKAAEPVIKQGLAKLGAVVGDPDPADPAPSVAPPPPPEPPAKIILQDADPGPLDSPAASFPPLGGSMGPRLVQEGGGIIELPEGLHVLGREEGLPITIQDGSISRRHAQFVCAGSDVSVSDLGSTNGTFVNGVRVEGDVSLRSGDTVQVGTIRLRFEG